MCNLIILQLKLYVLLTISLVRACPGFENVNSKGIVTGSPIPKPGLTLRVDEPRKHVEGKYFHHLEPNVALINMTGVLTLRLDCWAPYPIDLQFSGHLTNQETTVKTFRKEFGSVDEPKACFLINATMESFEQITGNYKCVGIENPAIFSSYYIYVSPSPPGVLLTRGQNIILQPEPGQTSVTFPCAVSHPNVHVQLAKFLESENPVGLSQPGLSYDPKVGFIMELRDDSFFGNYTCFTELSQKDKVNFVLLKPKKYKVIYPSIFNIRLQPNGQLNISVEATEPFEIVTYPKTLPIASKGVVQKRNVYVGTLISEKLDPKMVKSGYITCTWTNTNTAEEFARWSFSVLKLSTEKKPGQLDTTKLESACTNTSTKIQYECNNFVECRMNSCVKKDATCHSNGRFCTKDKDKTCSLNGLVQCITPKMSVSEVFFTGFPNKNKKTIRYVDWLHSDTDELLQVKQVTDSFPNNYNVLEISCQGSNFVFSSGFKWTIVYKNGTNVTLPSFQDGYKNISVNNSWRDKRSNLESKLSIPFQLAMETISSFECAAPVWNSWQWKSQTLSIKNVKSLKPRKNASIKISAFLTILGGAIITTFIMTSSIFHFN